MKLTTAPLKESLCVFMVGVQCRSWTSMWKVPFIAKRMGRMQKELLADPDSGLIWGTNFISFNPFTTLFLSYWKSSDDIHKFVTDRKFSHIKSSAEYWKKHGKNPDIGVWHETYDVDPLKTENLYFGMAPFGVSAFLETIPIDGKNKTYLSRLRRKET